MFQSTVKASVQLKNLLGSLNKPTGTGTGTKTTTSLSATQRASHFLVQFFAVTELKRETFQPDVL